MQYVGKAQTVRYVENCLKQERFGASALACLDALWARITMRQTEMKLSATPYVEFIWLKIRCVSCRTVITHVVNRGLIIPRVRCSTPLTPHS